MLGDLRNNSNNGTSKNGNKVFENTYYSRLNFKNNEKLRLGFCFKSGMLVVNIDQEKEGFQFETLASCYITPIKANILLKQIEAYKSDNTKCYGINTGIGEVATVLLVHSADGSDAVTIGKVNGDGNYLSRYTYKFEDINTGIHLIDITNMNTAAKDNTNGVEFEAFIQTLREFANNMNGAIAYSVADLARFDHNSILNKMNPIYDKLGIERGKFNKGSSENNFFNGNNGGFKGRSNSASLDDVMDDIPSEDE